MDLAWRGKMEASEPPEPRPRASRSLLARPRTPPERGASPAGARLDPSGSASPVHSQAQEMSYPQRVLPLLAPHLPLPIPAPEFVGIPDEGYPYPFAGYELIPGT